MASANEPGTVKIFAVPPSGSPIVTHQWRSDGFINAGKSPDGVLANLTRDKWAFINKVDNVILTGGWKVVLSFTPDATDGIDVSDCVIQIPITIAGGGIKVLNAADLTITTDLTPIADVETNMGVGYTIPDGQRVKIGGDYGVISIEDDTG